MRLTMFRHALAVTVMLAGFACTESDPPTEALEIAVVPSPPVPVVPRAPLIPMHTITVNANGSFSPMWTTVASGELVKWVLYDRTDSIIPSTWSGPYPAVCDTPKPWDPAALNNAVTGPMPVAAAGVFSLGPLEYGLVSTVAACGMRNGETTEVGSINGVNLCKDGPTPATLATTWADPEIDGVFIRPLWNQLEPIDCAAADPSCWNWTVLDQEIKAAVDNGKLYSIAVKAGDDGTPDWIFDTDAPVDPFNPVGAARPYAPNRVTRLFFQGGGTDDVDCGQVVYLGDPTDPIYQAQYNDMLTALATHIKSRSDWYRALAYVKPSGANLQSHENRLPVGCDTSLGCNCNTETWATAGYTQAGLEAFYYDQIARLVALFPGKTLSYQLIDNGFPRVYDANNYAIDDDVNGAVFVGDPLLVPGPSQQTENILAASRSQAAAGGFVWTVQHNGLSWQDPANASQGLPNQWVIDEANVDTTTVTGFQTKTEHKVVDRIQLDDTFVNLRDNAPEASFLEIYEERVWEVQQAPGALDVAGSGLTLGGWGDLLRDRRRAVFPSLRDPEPAFHIARVTSNLASGNLIVHYVHGSKCGQPGALYGALKITP